MSRALPTRGRCDQRRARGGYANVVTLGSYKTVKVDASFGAIHAGDMLTTSPTRATP